VNREEPIYSRLTNVFRAVFGDPMMTLSPDYSAKTIEAWDSLAHITLMVAIEQEFGIRFRDNELAEMKNIAELEAFLDRRAAY
jgi:acyl carrier protein